MKFVVGTRQLGVCALSSSIQTGAEVGIQYEEENAHTLN